MCRKCTIGPIDAMIYAGIALIPPRRPSCRIAFGCRWVCAANVGDLPFGVNAVAATAAARQAAAMA